MAKLPGGLLSARALDAVFELLVSGGEQWLYGVDGVSISCIRTGAFDTMAATSKAVRGLDQVQYDSGRGPCISAGRSAEWVSIALSESHEPWPEFAEAAITRGIRSVLCVPLSVEDGSLGVLNLYSRALWRFGAAQQRPAQLLATVVSSAVALANSELVIKQLHEALETRDVIGQAKGIIMARERLSSDEAFDILVRASQRENVKVRELARMIVATTEADTGRS